MDPKTVIRAFVPAAALALLSFVMIRMGRSCFTPYTGDANAYMPAILNDASGRGLVDPFFLGHRLLDPTGQARFLYHGFLLQLVASRIFHVNTAPRLHTFNEGIAITVMILTAAIAIARVTKGGRPLRWSGAFLALGLATATATYANGLLGRPEPFAMLLVALGVIGLTILPASFHWIVLGVVIGLLGVEDPGPSLFATCGAIAYFGWTRSFARAVGALIATGALSVGVALTLATLWYPFPIVAWIHGMRAHAHVAYSSAFGIQDLFNLTNIKYFWFTSGSTPMFGVVFACWLVCAIVLGRRDSARLRRAWPWLLPAVAAVFQICLRRHNENFYLMTFSPAAALMIAHWFDSRDRHHAAARWPVAALGLVLAAGSLGILRRCAQFHAFLREGMSVETARHYLDPLAQRNAPLAVDTIYWQVIEDPARIYDFNKSIYSIEPERGGGEYLVLQQAYRGWESAPTIPGFTVLEDHFVREPPKLFGLRVGSVVPGYQFALYRSNRDEVRAPLVLPGS